MSSNGTAFCVLRFASCVNVHTDEIRDTKYALHKVCIEPWQTQF